MSAQHLPQQPVLPVIVGHVVAVSVPGLGGGLGPLWPLCPLCPPLCPRGLVIHREQEMRLGAQRALTIQLRQEQRPAPAYPGPDALLHHAPGAVQGLHHVVHLPVGLTHLVSLLLHQGIKLSYCLLQTDLLRVIIYININTLLYINTLISESIPHLFPVYGDLLPVHLVHEGLVFLCRHEDPALVPRRGQLRAQS